MQKYGILIFLSLLVFSCKLNETPKFIKVSNINLKEYRSDKITLTSDLVFHNPNQIGGILQFSDIKVFVNTIDMGNIKTIDFKVPAQDEFTVPIEFEFPYSKIFKDKENILLNVLNTLTEKKINVEYKGTITYKLKLFSYDYPLDYSQEISLKKKI